VSDTPSNNSKPSGSEEAPAPPVLTASKPQLSPPVAPVAAVASPAVDDTRLVRLATPSFSGIVRAVLILAACAIFLYLVWRVRDVIRLVAISLFVALALFPLVDGITARTRLPRSLVILGTYLLLIAGVAVVGYVVVPSLVKEVGQLSHDAPHYAAELRRNGTFRHYDNRYHITTKLVDDARRLPQILGHLVGPLKDVTVQAASFIGQLVTVLAISFLLILHGREYVNLGLGLAGSREQRYRKLIIDINRAVADYVLGNIVISVFATIATWVVLTILGVPYALSLGFLVGFFDLIPLVGATLGAIFVAIATLTVDFPTATIVWIAFIIVWQRFEDYVVQPLVYGKALRANPIVTIVSVLAGAALLGILGALLAIPIAAAIQILIRDWWANRGHDAPHQNHVMHPPAREEPKLLTKATVEGAIRHRLDEDPLLRHSSEVAVSVDDGVVTLRGTVGSFGQRIAAVRDARKVDGVDDVDDQIEVRLLDIDGRSDAEVRGMVLQAIASDPDAPSESIDVKVTDGLVTLTGEVSYQFQSDAAYDDVVSVFGVIGITNEIRVVNP